LRENDQITYETLNKFDYLTMCIKEVQKPENENEQKKEEV
jgi:hypothetical protein